MIYTVAEIEVLALCGWCKDLPTNRAEIFPQDVLNLLQKQGLIRKSNCGLSYRATNAGYALMQKAGFPFEADKQYLGRSAALMRRIHTAEITGAFWRYGADVFRQIPGAEKGTKAFLPSFALRRKPTANVLGGTRLAGFLYTDTTAFIPYYLTPEDKGVYADVEQRTFRSEGLLCGRQPFVLYTGAGTLSDILKILTSDKCKNKNNTTDTHREAVQKFGCPVAVIPLDEYGMRQLRILEIPHYREKLCRYLLGNDFLPPTDSRTDGRSRTTKVIYLIGIDCNIIRFEQVANQGQNSVHIILLSSQAESDRQMLKGKNVLLHPIEAETVERILGISPELPQLSCIPFQTGKGEYVYVPSI